MGLKTFSHVDKRYFHLSGKFEWLIHCLLFVMNDFVLWNPFKCQFCTNCDILSGYNQKNDNGISLKWS